MVNPVQCGMPGLPNIHTSYRPPPWRSSWAMFHRVHSWLGEMARSQGSGGPGKAASSNTDEMPSAMIWGSRVVPMPGPARIRTLWSTSWDSARGSENSTAVRRLAWGVGLNETVTCPARPVAPAAPVCGMTVPGGPRPTAMVVCGPGSRALMRSSARLTTAGRLIPAPWAAWSTAPPSARAPRPRLAARAPRPRLAAGSPALATRLPQHVAVPGVGHPGQDEQQVGQPVQVAGGPRAHRVAVLAGRGPGAALGPAGHRPRHVQQRRPPASARQQEAAQGGQPRIVGVALALQPLDIGRIDAQ